MNITQEAEEQRKMAEEKNIASKFTWLLDAGHGGLLNNEYQTNGKRSPIWSDGSVYYEGVGNRQIAKKIGDKLDNLNIDYIYTVEPDDPTDVGLKARSSFINKLKYNNLLSISIHSNGFSKESAHGTQVHVYKNKVGNSSKGSLAVADAMIKALKFKFPETTYRGKDGLIRNNLHMTRVPKCPAVLLELFFMTNEKECREILLTEEGQNKIVDAIVAAITSIEKSGL